MNERTQTIIEALRANEDDNEVAAGFLKFIEKSAVTGEEDAAADEVVALLVETAQNVVALCKQLGLVDDEGRPMI